MLARELTRLLLRRVHLLPHWLLLLCTGCAESLLFACWLWLCAFAEVGEAHVVGRRGSNSL